MITDLLWQQASEKLFISKEQFLRNLEGWDIKTYESNGEPSFAILSKGPEFHFVSFGTGNPIPIRAIRDRLMKIVREYGHAVTRTPKDDARQNKFNIRAGFVLIGEDEYDWHYRLDGAAMKERATCLS